MTRYITIGFVFIPLPLIARALGPSTATLDKLASGAPSATIAMRVEWENGTMKYTTIPLAEYFAAATEAASHDD